MPFDDTDRRDDEGGGDPWCCSACHDRGYIHVMRILADGWCAHAIACPDECEMGRAWKRLMDEQEARMREHVEALQRRLRDG